MERASENQPRRNEEREDTFRFLRALRFFVVDFHRSRELIRNVCEAEFCAGAIRFGAIRRDATRRDVTRRDAFRLDATRRDAIPRGLACL